MSSRLTISPFYRVHQCPENGLTFNQMFLPTPVSIVKVIPHHHAQRPLLQVTLDSTRLTINSKHHGRYVTGLVGRGCRGHVEVRKTTPCFVPQEPHVSFEVEFLVGLELSQVG